MLKTILIMALVAVSLSYALASDYTDLLTSDRAMRWLRAELPSFIPPGAEDNNSPNILTPRVFPTQMKRGDPGAEITATVTDPSGVSTVYAEVGGRIMLMLDLDGNGRYTGFCGSNVPPGDYNVTVVAVDRAGNAATAPAQVLRVLDPGDLNANRIEDSLEDLGSEDERVIVLHDGNLTGSVAGSVQRDLGILPASSMVVPGNRITELSKMQGVKGIYKDQKLRILDLPDLDEVGIASRQPVEGLAGEAAGTTNPDDPRKSRGGLDGRGITVALVDTGVDVAHSALDDMDDDPSTDDPKVLAFKDFVNNQDYPYDDNGHGTHCASLIAGTKGIGVAPGSNLVVVKVMDRDGACYLSDALTALDWCLENRDVYGIKVISFSVGGENPVQGPSLLDQACNRMVDEGLIVVTAAGNSGPSAGSIVIPGSAELVITVGAVDSGGEIFERSSRGPAPDGRIKPDLVTLGVGLPSALAGSRDGESPMSGTSMAVPLVSGSAAVIMESYPGMRPADVKRALLKTADDLGEPGPDNTFGWGSLNLKRAIYSLSNGDPIIDPPSLERVDLSSLNATVGQPVVIEAAVSGEVDGVSSRISGPDREAEIPMIDFDSNGIYTTWWETGLWTPGDYSVGVELRGRYGENQSETIPFRLDPA